MTQPLKEMPDRFWNAEIWKMTVSDALRNPIFALTFLAMNIEP
jgi:hypothetical protein